MTAAINPAPAETEWKPSVNPWLIAVAVMLSTFMEVLDTSVANVALPHIAGNLSSTTDEATWVLTSYLVSNAIVLPMTGWLGIRFGRKRFLITCITAFSLASALCGTAPTLGVLIVARILQGAAGGALQPISQAILMESFPPAKRGVAMAIFAMGVVVAPIIGPTLGGWITDDYSWRWIFYINLPIGILAIYMCQLFIEDPPYLISARQSTTARIDYLGFSFMAIWLATLQVILDKGQQDDWFSAQWIRWAAAISFTSMVSFIFWELRQKQPIVNLRVLKNRNFALGTALITIVGVLLYSTITLQPLFLQSLMGYTALYSGLALSPRGIGAIIAVFFVGRVIGKLDSRILITCGFTTLAWVCYQLSGLNLQISISNIVIPNIVMGLAMGLIFVPLTTLTMGGLPNEQMGNAAGIFNLMRNLGGSIGISTVTTLLARNAQEHLTYISAHFTFYNPAFQQYFHKLGSFFALKAPADFLDPKTYQAMYNLAIQQASLLAYMDDFRILAFASLICIPATLALKGLRVRSAPLGVH
ncbi:Drug resistance transporter, EmrB/QacA subfamily [Syntrophobacter sp. SbD1]|nr:Drug resistance transporter, EmrB/QacA subfamily [Syntrophobacter sp. SbD1]